MEVGGLAVDFDGVGVRAAHDAVDAAPAPGTRCEKVLKGRRDTDQKILMCSISFSGTYLEYKTPNSVNTPL